MQLADYHATVRKESEEKFRQLEERLRKRLEEVEQRYEVQVQKLSTERLLAQSDDELLRCRHKIESQELVIHRLQEDLKRAPTPDQLATLEKTIVRLKEEIETLKAKLSRAKEFHTPTMQHFETLEWKIRELETRLQLRENEIQRICHDNEKTKEIELEALNNKWEQALLQKNTEMERFRTEMDSILDVLRQLRKQGVRIPV
eukprot:m.234343 g.234343  ORF g.234343 m.234343 type:complete len:202 (-) comp22472_c0_seq12:44-649(-)